MIQPVVKITIVVHLWFGSCNYFPKELRRINKRKRHERERTRRRDTFLSISHLWWSSCHYTINNMRVAILVVFSIYQRLNISQLRYVYGISRTFNWRCVKRLQNYFWSYVFYIKQKIIFYNVIKPKMNVMEQFIAVER